MVGSPVSYAEIKQPVWKKLELSVRPLISDDKILCGAFGVNVYEFITAAHCVTPGMTLDGKPVEVIKIDTKKDLARLRAELPSQSLPIAKKKPELGDEVYSVGYPLLLKIKAAWKGIVAAEKASFPAYTPEPLTMVYPNTTFGFSGAPVVNSDGEVVGVVKGGGQPGQPSQLYGLQIRWEDVRKFVTGK